MLNLNKYIATYISYMDNAINVDSYII